MSRRPLWQWMGYGSKREAIRRTATVVVLVLLITVPMRVGDMLGWWTLPKW